MIPSAAGLMGPEGQPTGHPGCVRQALAETAAALRCDDGDGSDDISRRDQCGVMLVGFLCPVDIDSKYTTNPHHNVIRFPGTSLTGSYTLLLCVDDDSASPSVITRVCINAIRPADRARIPMGSIR